MHKDVILLVEDDTTVAATIKEFLVFLINTQTTEVATACSTEEARTVIATRHVKILITDINLGFGEEDGFALVMSLQHCKKRPYIIVMSSLGAIGNTEKYRTIGIIDSLLSKPFLLDDIKNKLIMSNSISLK